jgi:predicted CopG family antitoxin
MANITLSIPKELFRKMKTFREIRWSEVARQAIKKRIEDLEIMNKIASKSKLTKDDVKEMSKRIRASASKKF